ncbi:hypothetical protein [Brevibacillus sp. SIMBA_040]|uniref:hypothetical protein n=1 Tax=unclassified Brevibacillus TaxID=2684853 RepID=UPI00397C052E
MNIIVVQVIVEQVLSCWYAILDFVPFSLLEGFVRAYTVRAIFIAHGVPSTGMIGILQWA